ncbi:MAG TPA: polyamine aminopropyltransferase [Rhabdochlamydiaceae bacterium]|nr:polyamine aminopropyltransferase [Rhabdochlamydiaceae bacterium]
MKKKNAITLTAFLLAANFTSLAHSSEWYTETLYDHWRQTLKMDEVLYQEQTKLQDLVIFQNKQLGRVMALDGVIQLTEADEYIYHEMLAHVPILTHGHVRNVLIIGGGDGGMLREVVRHKNIERIVLVEIDSSVVEFSKKFLPDLSQGAFDDPRVEIVIQDGAEFVKTKDRKFDVIICDSTDPIGPGQVLFTKEFYGDCKALLSEGGIFVNQNGVPFMQKDEITDTYSRRLPFFKDTGFYIASVPTYVGGFMAFGWASDSVEYRQLSVEEIARRFSEIEGEMRYYTPAIHKASFALPRFVEKLLISE